MPGWKNSDRRDHLPANWAAIRQERFKLDGFRCTAKNTYGERCLEPAEECDHIAGRTNHSLGALRSLCSWHHAKKSSREGAFAAYQERKKINAKFRRTETHPGLR